MRRPPGQRWNQPQPRVEPDQIVAGHGAVTFPGNNDRMRRQALPVVTVALTILLVAP